MRESFGLIELVGMQREARGDHHDRHAYSNERILTIRVVDNNTELREEVSLNL